MRMTYVPDFNQFCLTYNILVYCLTDIYTTTTNSCIRLQMFVTSKRAQLERVHDLSWARLSLSLQIKPVLDESDGFFCIIMYSYLVI